MDLETFNFNSISAHESWVKIVLIPVLLIISVFQSTVNANSCNPTLYGASYIGPSSGGVGLATLYSINPASGFATQLGATGFKRISGLDTNQITGVTYGAGDDPVTNTPVLITIDRITGSGTLVGELAVNERISGLSIRDSDSSIFAYGGNEGVFIVDASDGTVNVLFEQDEGTRSGNSIAFSPGDILYHADSEDLHTVDQTTGLLTVESALTFNFPASLDTLRVAGVDYAPEHAVYYALVKAGVESEVYLATLDVTTGDVNHIGRTADALSSLTYVCAPPDPSGKIFKNGFEGHYN